MTQFIWTQNGKIIVDADGRPVLCEKCPCDAESCVTQTTIRTRELTSPDDDGIVHYVIVSAASSAYSCPRYDAEGQLISEGSGELVLSLGRGAARNFTDYRNWTHATTLKCTDDNTYLTIGCLCTGEDRRCQTSYAEIAGHCIAGTAAAHPASPCECEPCALYSLVLKANSRWHGGSTGNEGYIDNYDADTDTYTYQAHRMSYRYTVDDVETVAILDCDCTGIAVEPLDGELHHLSGICSSECEPYFVLRRQSIVNGWQWFDEGVFFPLASCTAPDDTLVYSDWYEFTPETYMGGAIDGATFRYVTCACELTQRTMQRQNSAATDALWILPYMDACRCVDERELIVENATKLGILDMSWQSNTIVGTGYDEYTEEWDEVTGTWLPATYTYWEYRMAGDFDYLDYRTFCYISKEFDSSCSVLARCHVVSPSDSRPDYSWTSELYPVDRIGLFGKAKPFAYNELLSQEYRGHIWRWMAHGDYSIDHNFETEADAQEYLDNYTPQPPYCTAEYITEHGEPHAIYSPPSTGSANTLIEGRVVDAGDGSDWGWYVEEPYYMYDRVIEVGQYNMRYTHYLNWLETNRGFLVNGVDGHATELQIWGIKGRYGDTGWSQNNGWDDDTILSCSVYNDKGFCHEDFSENYEVL